MSQEKIDLTKKDPVTVDPEDGEAHVWVQAQPPWEDFASVNVDQEAKRKPATPEQVKEMDKRMAELGDAFAGSKLNWHLDGALNISLLAGKYIGYHKDVDVSVEQTELAQLEAQLFDHGYGLFLSSTNNETGERQLRRVGFRVFEDSEKEHMLIAAIDERGKLRDDKTLNFVDVHVVARNEAGEALGCSDVVIPEKWAKPYPVEFNGKQINLSHPGKVLYYKLHQDRNYDLTDIDRLVETGKLSVEDVDDIAAVYEAEFKSNIEKARKYFEPISAKITADMTAEQIAQLFIRTEFQRGSDEVNPAFVELGEQLIASGNSSVENMIAVAIEIFGMEEKNNKKRAEILKIRKAVEAQAELVQVREQMSKS